MSEGHRAVGITCGIGSLLIGAKQAGFDVTANIEWRKYYHRKDERGLNTFAENFYGAAFRETLDQLTPQEIERAMNPTLALGHPECLPGTTKIYTSKGWKKIFEIELGELVLTHLGRFKPVVQKITKNHGGEFVALRTKTGQGEDGTLFITIDHAVRIGESWIKAGEVRVGDRVKVLAVQCLGCKKLVPVWCNNNEIGRPKRRYSRGAAGFCSVSCRTSHQWRTSTDDEKRILTDAANKRTREICATGYHPFQDKLVRRKAAISNGTQNSSYEVRMRQLLEERKITAEHQYPVGPYFIDFALIDLKIAIEVDGGYWHNIKKEQDQRRDTYLRSQGWTVIRVVVRNGARNPVPDLITGLEEIQRVMMNHSGEYRFVDAEIKEIERYRRERPKVYTLSVLDDNSYCAKGFIVENCGAYSQLSSMNPDKSDDPGDIPLFCDLVARIRPRYFAMDDLPKSFKAFPMSEYAKRLPDYDLSPEWISNYHYGNVQKNRKRMFMIGSLKSERWAFVPGERENAQTLADVIGDLGEPRRGSNYPNHDPHTLEERCGRAKHLVTLGRDRDATYAQLRDFFLSVPPGATLAYVSRHPVTTEDADAAVSTGMTRRLVSAGLLDPKALDGGGLLVKCKPGHARGHWDAHAYVLDGASIQVHPHTGLPYTIRERARIQGFPDDFVFYGARLNPDGTWNHEKNNELIRQTGKAMPIQFGRYVSEQVMAHVTGRPFETSGARLIPANPWVDEAKRWYCENVGYADQPRACGACWLYDACTIRMRKYQIGEPARGQRDAFDPGVVPGPDADAELEDGGERDAPALAEAAAASSTGPRRARRSASDPGRRRASAARPAASRRFTDLPREEEYDLADGEP